MAAAKLKPDKKHKAGIATRNGRSGSAPTTEVLNLDETAAYLRIEKKEVLRLIDSQELPGRNIGNDWRFLKAALQIWLCSGPVNQKGLLGQLGAIKDDPFADDLLKEIYQRRGRPELETEEG